MYICAAPKTLPLFADRFDLSVSRDARDFSYSREVASRVTSSSTTTAGGKGESCGNIGVREVQQLGKYLANARLYYFWCEVVAAHVLSPPF